MRYKDVAIIGMSMRFAGVDNKEEFRNLLLNKKTGFGKPSQKRLEQMGCDPDSEYLKCGYLDDISGFDYGYFKINKKEAELMAPEQRICLEMAAETILDAGYSLESVRGSKCAVLVCGSDMEYADYIKRNTSTSIMGSMRCMLSGKIGFYFDLQGENMTFDSGCSSALAAVHYGCQKLTHGEADMALVGGIQLFTKPLEKKKNEYQMLGIVSQSEKLEVFGEEADGTLPGEGGGFVLLKILDKAIEDKDHIYGVIEAGALNSDGARCVNVSMPSTKAQQEVVLSAWRETDISRITEVEAHSIGSAVGDAVEIQGLIEAIKKRGNIGHEVKLGTCKQNTGHLFSMSGMAGLLKVITGYYYNETYPLVELGKSNPMINFEDSEVRPVTNAFHWDECAERLTAISAFGLAGSNAHILVRNYPKNKEDLNNYSTSGIIKISARNRRDFEENNKSIVRMLDDKNIALEDIVYTLNNGRDDYNYRTLLGFENRTEFKNALESAIPIKVKENENRVFIVYCVRYENGGYEEISGKIRIFRELEKAGLKPDTVMADRFVTEALKSKSFSIEQFNELVKNNEYVDKSKEFEKMIATLEKKKKEEGIKLVVLYINTDSDIFGFTKRWFEEGCCVNDTINRLNCDIEGGRESIPFKLFDDMECWIDICQKEDVKPKQQQDSDVEENHNELPQKNVFLLKGEEIRKIDIHKFPYNDKEFRDVFEAVSGKIDLDCKLAMYKKIVNKGIKPDVVLADQRCGALIQYAKNKISKEGLITASCARINDNYEKIFAAIDKLSKDSFVTVFDFGYSNDITKHPWNSNVQIIHLLAENALKTYRNGKNIQKVKAAEKKTDVKEEKQPEKLPQKPETSVVQKNTEKTQKQKEAEDFLEKIWSKALNCDGPIGHDEDFFYLGGNSLVMQMISVEINEHFKKDFDIFEIYDYETIEKLADRILEAA